MRKTKRSLGSRRDGRGAGTMIRLKCAAVTSLILLSIVACALPCAAGEGGRVAVEPCQSGFDTWILLENPHKSDATARVEFTAESGRRVTEDVPVKADSRRTVFANEYIGGESFSTEVSSDQPLIAERSEYFSYSGSWEGGHSQPGLTEPSRQWYFAEGYTGPGFDEWLLIQNPQDRGSRLEIEFLTEAGEAFRESYEVPPRSRLTLCVDSVPGVGGKPASMVVRSTLPVLAERAMYFLYQGRIEGGDVVPGARAPRNDWMFAEGYCGDGFDTWLLLLNPNEVPVEATVYFDTGWV
jgi:hypothetical protein